MKDLVSAFAENSRLPKMLRQKEILDTIDQGVQDGIFVALLTRPDKSIKTWWRTPIAETARKEPALEVFLPDKANRARRNSSGCLNRAAVTSSPLIRFLLARCIPRASRQTAQWASIA